MIPTAYITEWRAQSAPWPEPDQVEQDLILSRALVEIFSEPAVSEMLAFRGGTALHKLFVAPGARHSEDLDLVQVVAGPSERALKAIRESLDPWLGTPKRRKNTIASALGASPERVTFLYRVRSEQGAFLQIKIEVNVQEHMSVLGPEEREVEVRSGWFSGRATVKTFGLEELLGTKMRALYQRKKGRDLFDLWTASRRNSVDPDRVIQCFEKYMAARGQRVTREAFERNLSRKVSDPAFLEDVKPLLAEGSGWDAKEAMEFVLGELLSRLPEKERGRSLMRGLSRRRR